MILILSNLIAYFMINFIYLKAISTSLRTGLKTPVHLAEAIAFTDHLKLNTLNWS
jgi:hypothetical protein